MEDKDEDFNGEGRSSDNFSLMKTICQVLFQMHMRKPCWKRLDKVLRQVEKSAVEV